MYTLRADLGDPAPRAGAPPSATRRSTCAPASSRSSSRSSLVLLVLSAWPARDQRALVPGRPARLRLVGGGAVIVAASIATPDGRLARALAAARAARRCRRSACSAPSSSPRGRGASSPPRVAVAGFVAAGVLAAVLFDRSPEQQLLIAESMTRDRLAALTADPRRRVRRSPPCSSPGATAAATTSASTTRSSPPPAAGMVFFVSAREPDDALPRARVVLDRLYVLVALDTRPRRTSLEAGLKYLIVGSFGSAVLLFGSALVYGATGELGLQRDPRRHGRATTRSSSPGSR